MGIKLRVETNQLAKWTKSGYFSPIVLALNSKMLRATVCDCQLGNGFKARFWCLDSTNSSTFIMPLFPQSQNSSSATTLQPKQMLILLFGLTDVPLSN